MEKGSFVNCSLKNVVAMSSVVEGDDIEEEVEAHCWTKDLTLSVDLEGTTFSYEEKPSMVFGT
jgi:hypothetical protein